MFERNRNRHGVLLLILGLVCFLSAAVLIHSFKGRFGGDTVGKITVDLQPSAERTAGGEASEKTAKQVAAVPAVPKEGSEGNGAVWEVYVTGSVKRPGVYAIPEGSRIHSALEAAGGFASEADIEAVNLAEKLVDGSHIRFPAKDESSRSETAAKGIVSGFPTAPSRGAGLVDINRAGPEELQRLPGIGPKTADKIIDHRERNGAFVRKEDLLLIKGIGAAKYDALKDLVTVER